MTSDIWRASASIFFSVLLATSEAIAQPQSATGDDHPRAGRLIMLARAAKARGELKIIVPPLKITTPSISSVSELLDSYTLVTGNVIDGAVASDSEGDSIWTWYKVRVSEWLVKQRNTSTEFPMLIPPQLLPLGPNDVVFAISGGTLMVEGLTAEQSSPPSSPTQLGTVESYVFAFLLTSHPGAAILASEKAGIFRVSPNHTFTSLGNPDHPLMKDVEARYSGQFDIFVRDVRRRNIQ